MSKEPSSDARIVSVAAFEYGGKLYRTSIEAEKARAVASIQSVFSYIPNQQGLPASVFVSHARDVYAQDIVANHRIVVEALSKIAAAEAVALI